MQARAIKMAKYLRENRLKKRWSQADLSVLLGFDRGNSQMISNIERSLCQFPIHKIGQLSKLFEVEKEEVIDIVASDYREAIIKSVETVERLTR